ncbi:hypothetical protein DMUE_5356, partial [Dictyocoela muelleri]
RRVSTLTEVLGRHIRIGSILKTDGYPLTASNLSLRHEVVNHSNGFVTEDEIHTNNIEGFWSHLKSQMRKQNGVHRMNIDDWLVFYSFRRKYIIGKDGEIFAFIYIEILKHFFNYLIFHIRNTIFIFRI